MRLNGYNVRNIVKTTLNGIIRYNGEMLTRFRHEIALAFLLVVKGYRVSNVQSNITQEGKGQSHKGKEIELGSKL